MDNPLRNLKFLFPLLGLIAGIFIGDKIPTPLLTGFICIGLSIAFWLLIHFLCLSPEKTLQFSKFHNYWIFSLFTGIGLIILSLNLPDVSYFKDSEKEKFHIEGEIRETTAVTEGDRLIIDVLSVRDSKGEQVNVKNLRLLVKTDGLCASPGDLISFQSSVTPFINTDNHYYNSLRHRGIGGVVSIKSSDIKNEGESGSFNLWINRIREDIEIKIEKSRLNRDTGDFLISVLLGNKYFLSPEVRKSLSSAGLAHILALSGMHVGIIIAVLAFFLFPLSLLKKHKLKYIILLTFMWAYVILTGGAASTLRAAIMATLVILSLILERQNSSLNSLFVAAFIILLFDPLSLWNIGFQLSFVSVAAIIIFVKPFNRIEQHIHPFTHKIVNFFLVTLIASFATWSLVAFYFKNIPLLFLPANIILLPLFPLFVGIGIVYLFLLCAGFDNGIFAYILDKIYDWVIQLTGFLSPGDTYLMSVELSSVQVILWMLGFLFLSFAIYSPSSFYKKINFSLSVAALVVSFGIFSFYETPENKTVFFPHSFTSMQARVFENGSFKDIKFKRQSLTTVQFKKHNFIAVDCRLKNDNIKEDFFDKFKGEENEGKNFLLVGPDADFPQISELISNVRFDKIILHSSVGKNKKQEFLDLIPARFHQSVFSSRDNGGLEFDL